MICRYYLHYQGLRGYPRQGPLASYRIYAFWQQSNDPLYKYSYLSFRIFSAQISTSCGTFLFRTYQEKGQIALFHK
jgi:hypothetical protein